MGIAAAAGACAGRAPQPVAVVQPLDRYSDCTAITAEIEANNQKVSELASEQGLKVGQNVAADQRCARRYEGAWALRAGLFRDRRVPQCVRWKAAVLALRSIKPGALDNLPSVGRHADDRHRHPWTPGFQLDRIPDLKAHSRPRIPLIH
jgi:hypothetical protein